MDLGDVLAFVTSVIFACILFFIMPILLLSIRSDNTVQNYVDAATVQFVDTSKATGKITKESYEKLIKRLDNTGYVYDLTILDTKNQAVPVYDDNNNFTGEISNGTSVHTTDEVLDALYNKDGTYAMSDGDLLQVTVTCRSDTVGAKMYKLLSSRESQKISVNYGGYVTNDPQLAQ